MNQYIEHELERLTVNCATRREMLLASGITKSRVRKQLNILGGVLALFSAATIASAVARLFGADGKEFIGAAVAFLSGVITLVANALYGDDEIVGAFGGSAKYLALRDAVFRLAISQDMAEKQKLRALTELQQKYHELDVMYSKFFVLKLVSLAPASQPSQGEPAADEGSARTVALKGDRFNASWPGWRELVRLPKSVEILHGAPDVATKVQQAIKDDMAQLHTNLVVGDTATGDGWSAPGQTSPFDGGPR